MEPIAPALRNMESSSVNALSVSPAAHAAFREHSEQCPHCDSGKWVRLHRSWWQKITHKHQNLCICLHCNKEFWKGR